MFTISHARPLQRLLLWLLLAVLPLQATTALVGAVKGQRHVHFEVDVLGGWIEPLRAWVMPQGPLLFASVHAAGATRNAQPHVHDGTPHRHAAGEAGVASLGDSAEGDGINSAAALGLALLPSMQWRWSAGGRQAFATPAVPTWHSHTAPPPLRPPLAG